MQAQRPQHPHGRVALSATRKIVSPSAAPIVATIAASSGSLRNFAIGRADLAAGLHLQPGDALAAPRLGELDQVVEVLAGELLCARAGEAAHHAAAVDHPAEGLELGAAQARR